jgi:light-regulated signal transduction histidine kinase (bacteriophytochrome)
MIARDEPAAVIAAHSHEIARLGERQVFELWLGTIVIAGGSTLACVGVVLGLRVARHHRIARDEAFDRLATQADALGKQGADLERRNRDLDQFAYIASHDLKAPLRGIASLVTWLEEDLGGDADATAREHLRLLRSRVLRLEALIEGVLAYARADKLRGPVASVDTRRLIDDVLDLAPPPTGVVVEVVGDWPTLTTDRAPLQQVWINLLSNAYKHAARPGRDVRIELGAAQDPEAWRFWVEDDGPGIDPRYHERVFQMFQTLQPRDRLESTGIGLAIVRRLVEAHGGKVWVDSRSGEGVRFSFTWSSS